MKAVLQAQNQGRESDLTENKIKRLGFCSHFLYSHLGNRTIWYLLPEISDQVQITERASGYGPLSKYTNVNIYRTMGLTYAYFMSEIQPFRHLRPHSI